MVIRIIQIRELRSLMHINQESQIQTGLPGCQLRSNIDSMKYSHGDEILVTALDDSGHAVKKYAVIVAITPVENDEQARQFKVSVGTILYTVEFNDGSDALLAEDQLEMPPK